LDSEVDGCGGDVGQVHGYCWLLEGGVRVVLARCEKGYEGMIVQDSRLLMT
jgi:hypothetical protein